MDLFRVQKEYNAMHYLSVQIVRYADGSSYPGWVDCELVDAAGRTHVITEKVPLVTSEDLDADSKYPLPGEIACEILERYEDDKGRELVRVRTVESTEGLSEFVVPASCVTTDVDQR
jgi:hypothetical protein